MTNYYLLLFFVFLGTTITHLGFIVKKHSTLITSFFWNEKININPNIDRIKLLLTSVFFISPILLVKSFINFNPDRSNLNFLIFTSLIVIEIFCFWFNINKIDSLRPLKKNTIKKGRKDISSYKLIALMYLLEEKFYRKNNEFRKHNTKIDFCKAISLKNKNINDSKTLSNNITTLEKENLDTIFKRKNYKKYIPLLLREEFIKEKSLIFNFLKKIED